MRDLRWKGSAETGRLETDAERDRRLILMDAFDVVSLRESCSVGKLGLTSSSH